MIGEKQPSLISPWQAFVHSFVFVTLLFPSLVCAVPAINTATDFTSADSARANNYMDSSGVWDGSSEVTNTTGDRFSLILTNTAAGVSPIDDAFDIDLTVTPPAGFRLPSSPNYPVSVNASGGGVACVAPVGVTATQAGGVGTAITFNFPADTNLPAENCQFTIEFGLTTTDVASFVQEGTYSLAYNFTYNEIDDDAGSQQSVNVNQNIEVREGDVAVLKVADTSSAGDGDTVQFTVSILGSGNGGNFNVVLTDVLSSDLSNLLISAPVAPPGSAGPGGNEYTFEYIAPGERVDVTITATVNVDANALTCPTLRNTAQVTNRIGSSNQFFDDVPFNLENPLLSYTAPDIDVAVGSTQAFSIPVQNVGAGIARNVALQPVNLNLAGFVITLPVSETDWIFTGTEFQYVGNPADPNDDFLTSGQSTQIDFNVTVSGCPGPAGGQIDWTPSYENICGTDFSPPIVYSNSSVTNVPALNIAKTGSAGALNIGEAGSYDITFNGTDLNNLPTDGVDNNNEFSVTDTLPVGIGSAVINTIPASTTVTVNSFPYTAGDPIPDGAVIVWSGDYEDLQPTIPTLTVNYVVTAAACPITPGNQIITNTANLAYPGCSITDADSAAFIANQNPAGALGQNIALIGSDFETGLVDTNGTPGDANEGDHMVFTVSYTFPDPDGAGAGTFPGQWIGSTFTADLGFNSLAQPMRLVNNLSGFAGPMTVTVERISGGPDPLPEQVVAGVAANTAGPINVALDFIDAAIGDSDINDYRLIFRYTATADDAALGAGTTANFVEAASIDINGGPLDCTGGSQVYVQGVNVNLARADTDISLNINNGSPVEVCEVVPLTINLSDPGNGTTADNIGILFNDSRYEFVDSSGNAGNVNSDFTLGGALSGLTVNGSRSVNDITWTVAPNTQNVSAAGSLSFNVRLRDNGAPTTLTAQVSFDDNETSPDIGAGENDQDFSNSISPAVAPEVLAGNLNVEFLPASIILVDQTTYQWTAQVVNTGTGTAYGAAFTTTLPVEFNPDLATPDTSCNSMSISPVINVPARSMTWDLGDLSPGESCNVIVQGTITQNSCFQPQANAANQITAEASWGCGTSINTTPTPPAPPIELPPNNLEVFHDVNDSYCELCDEGEIHLIINNAGSVEISNIDVTEDLLTSGLQYVLGSATISIDGGAPLALVDPAQSGSQLTWSFANFGSTYTEFTSDGLSSAFASPATNPQRVEIIYRVTSPGEALIANSRNIQATATFDLFCSVNASGGIGALSTTSALFELPLRQPIPTVAKQGRNYSARQTASDYADSVYGGTDDILVWRVNIANSGALASADLEDLLINDTITPLGGPPVNLVLNYLCPSEAAADGAAAAIEANGGVPPGTPPSPCIDFDSSYDVDDPFGNPANDEPTTYIDVSSGSSANVFYVGLIQAQCTNDNNIIDIEWGCDADTPAGGIDASTPGTPLGIDDDDTALMSTDVNPAGVTVTQTVTGTNILQPLGTKGIVTVTVVNNSGGTIRNLVLGVDVPADYEIDLTSLVAPFTPVTVTPAFNVYPGMTDTFSVDTSNADPNLGSPGYPEFTFASSNNSNTTVNQRNLLRNGDQLVLTFNIIRVTPFDDVNNPEVRTELAGSTDPTYAATGSNTLAVNFEDTCSQPYDESDIDPASTINLSVTINPEDIDVNINPADPDLFFILSDPAATLDLDVVVTNNGGHDATDFDIYVTIGDGMDATTIPGTCTFIPDPLPAELLSMTPAFNSADSKTYRCVNNDPLEAGTSNTFSFTVERHLPIGESGDLTFRADVLGETTSSDGVTAPPGSGEPGYPYYSKDNIIARIIGFNLFKRMLGNCSEDNPPPISNSNVLIGEECTYQVEANWFGFATPGFGNITIQGARIYEGSTANNPPLNPGDPPDALDGQGFVGVNTSGTVTVNTTNPASPAALTETGFMWLLDDITATGATQESFIADIVYRNLNDPLNVSAAPNVHDATRTDEVNATFSVAFSSSGGGPIAFDENSDGYPPTSLRTVTVTITEPNVVITKEVCNETRNGGPCMAGDFQASPPGSPTVTGDSDDVYVFRLTVENQAAGTNTRAPAYDVDITDVMDTSDQFMPDPMVSDGLDNDGDGSIDEADENIAFDTVYENGTPAQFTFAAANSTALQRIDEGTPVELFYRARLATTVTPLQELTNTVDGVYDTLSGATGNQTAPTGANGTLGGARIYSIAQDQATIQVEDVTIPPGSKEFITTSRRDSGLVAGTCTLTPPDNVCLDEFVVIGEEVLVELKFSVPVSTLNGFTLSDALPDGLECVEAFDVELQPYNPPAVNPGFQVGGTFTADTCDATSVSWDFGDQRLLGLSTNDQYDVTARFIARVQNDNPPNFRGEIIRNGGTGAGSTDVIVTYRDSSNTLVEIRIAQARLTVEEPFVALTKTMGAINPVPPPLVNVLPNADAADVVRVEVVLENQAGANVSPIYDNLRILDDLAAVANLSYIGNLAGPNIPDAVDTATLGANRPIFIFNSGNPVYPINPGDSLRFSFDILVGNSVQPLEVLDNTLSAAWTSLPSNAIALNASGVIGADGATNGMRIGSIPNAGDGINNYEQQASASMTVPSVSIVKTDLDPATTELTIGEHKRYQIVVNLPEGISNNLIINDILDSGDTSYILENEAAYDIVYQCTDISTINGAAVTDCSDTEALEAALVGGAPADESSGTVSWNFATVVTQTEDDIQSVGVRNPSITLTYYVRAANDASTFDGEQLGNDGQVSFTHGENSSTVTLNDATALITVIEPDLEVDKRFIDLPPPIPPGTVIQGRDADFEIEVVNVGNATAWDVTITDSLPNLTDPIPPANNREQGGFCDAEPSILSIDAGGRSLTVNTDYTTRFIPPASDSDLLCTYVITLIPDQAGGSIDARLQPGEALTVRYRTTPDLGTPDAINLTNVAGATEWFSLDTDGSSVPPEIRRYTRSLTLPPSANPGTVGIDDHQDAVTVQTQSPIISIEKSVANITTGQDPTNTVSPGDTLRYSLLIENSGLVDALGVRVTDDLDALNIINFSPGYFENSPAGTLRNITFPAGASNNSQQSGGSNNAGFLDIGDITVPAGTSVNITFDVDLEDLDTPLPKAFVENAANVEVPGFETITSDTTQTEIINIEAGFRFEKTVADISGDANVLELGDTLRYTITIKNIGNAADPTQGITHAVNSVLLDQIPANTRYLANSTTLNGSTVDDVSEGVSPLSDGLLINSPDTSTQGFLTANSDLNDESNVAVVSFDVTVNDALINSTIISNQAVLTGQQQAIAPFTPVPFNPAFSDDPSTPDIPNDPTQSIVGNGVNLDVLKTVEVISGGNNIANTGETLRYTIVVANKGNITATNVRVQDVIPVGVDFIANSIQLNGNSLSSDASDLASGIPINSSDTTNAGEISPGESAILLFDVTITAANGTLISNQAMILSNEQPDEPSDADANDENGDQATTIIVGSFSDLNVSKEVLVVGGGVAQAGGQLEYWVRIENVGSITASNIVVSDPMPDGTSYVSGSAQLNGSTAGISFANNVLTVNVGDLEAGDSTIVRFRVAIDQANASDERLGEPVENTVTVTADGGIDESDSANLDIGGAPGVSNINGLVWHNLLHDEFYDSQTEIPLENWRVRIYVNNANPGATDTPLAETLTDANGRYSFNGLAPVAALSLSGAYSITFSVPDDAALFPPGSNTGLGQSISVLGQSDLMRINAISIAAGRNAMGENLPLDPTGIVYNSVTREGVVSARVSLLDVNGSPLPESCFNTPAHLDSQQNQITSINGYYRFDINHGNSNCPNSASTYSISVETLDNDDEYQRNISAVIPPDLGPLNVSACPDNTADQVPSPPTNTCEVQEQALAPDPYIPPGNGTRYFLDVSLRAGLDTLYNNHIPVDLDVGFLVSISKQTPLKNVVKGQLVPYIITVTNEQDFAISALEIRDFFPPGFKYIEGSGTVDGIQVEPITDASTFFDDSLNAGTLTWNNLFVDPQGRLIIKLLLIVGSGVGEAEYVNRAQAFITGLGSPISEQASATVRVIPDPTFDCSDIIGKVFDDKNVNGYQDKGEPGIAGVRVVTAQGLLITTDQYGRFHIVCPNIPNYERGSNFIIKLDERSLPSGYRVVTENPRIVRLTRGKLSKFNFGATLHRVVRLDLADAAFVGNKIELKTYWKPVYEQLFEELRAGPSVLRLSYMGDAESKQLVEERLQAIKADIEQRWQALNCCYNLLVEKEVFWRRGQSSSSEHKP